MMAKATPSGGHPSEWLCLGKLGRPLGLQGWQRFLPYCENLELLQSPVLALERAGFRGGILESLGIPPEWKGLGRQIRMAGTTDRSGAEAFTHAHLWLPRSELPPLNERDCFYWSELQGFEVWAVEPDRFLGQVDLLQEGPGYDYLVLTAKSPCPGLWIPWIWEVFLFEVDRSKGRIWVDGGRLGV